MHLGAKALLVAGATALAATSWAPAVAQAQDSEPIHIALADLPEVETLFFLVGLARAGEKGLDYELTFFNGHSAQELSGPRRDPGEAGRRSPRPRCPLAQADG